MGVSDYVVWEILLWSTYVRTARERERERKGAFMQMQLRLIGIILELKLDFYIGIGERVNLIRSNGAKLYGEREILLFFPLNAFVFVHEVILQVRVAGNLIKGINSAATADSCSFR